MRLKHMQEHAFTVPGKAIEREHITALYALTGIDRGVRGTVFEASVQQLTDMVRDALRNSFERLKELEMMI